MAIRMMAAALVVVAAPANAGPITASATVDPAARGVRIAPEIYGQFAEQLGSGITGGIWVGEDSSIPNIRGYRRDVVEALQKLHVPVIRWPGGCYADIYYWRDGIGKRGQRTVTLNKWWGNKEEDNQFGTHEYFDFAELLGSKTYLNVNVGGVSPAESMDWINYITDGGNSSYAKLRRANGRDKPWKLDYVGMGNEMWGCGGNLKAEEFAPMVRRYGTFLTHPGTRLIAAGANGGDFRWTDVLMEGSRKAFDDISVHYYTLPTGSWSKKGSAIGFPEAEWASTFKRTRAIEPMIVGHDAAMTKYDPEKKQGLIVAEWGTWYDPTPGSNPGYLVQENTLRDALVAALNFNIFHRHADRVKGANIAQMVNVLQAMIHTDGGKMVLTPTYWAFLMYQPFQGAEALPVGVTTPDYAEGVPAVDVTVARGADGKILVAITNVDPDDTATIGLAGLKPGAITGQVLTAKAMDARNSYASPDVVKPAPFSGARFAGGKLNVTLPAKSVVVLTIG